VAGLAGHEWFIGVHRRLQFLPSLLRADCRKPSIWASGLALDLVEWKDSMLERLTSHDKRLIVLAILVSVASVAYIRHNFFAAFPEASIDLRHSKEEITGMANRFLRERGLSTAGYRQLTLFDPDEEARTYLEREVGVEQANRLMQSDVAVWRWRARWFRPPEQEEMTVYVSPTGRVVGFRHVVPEAQPGARLEMEAARKLASDFLAARTQAPQRLIEEERQSRPARHDYTFTWEQEGFRARDATYRRTVVVQGDRVGSYSEYLHVPEKWTREFAALRSHNELYATVAEALYVPLILAAVGLVIQGFRKHQVRWRPLAAIAGAVGLLMIGNQWNSLPFFIDQAPTSSPLPKTIVFALLQGLGAGVGVFFYVILAGAAGEPLYRGSQPRHLALASVFRPRGIRTKEFFVATVVGYGFAAVHIAFVVAFYLIGRRFGVWSPQDINYSDFLSTSLPWIYPLAISLLASTSEEFWFRLLAIPLLRRWLRSTWAAVILPAFVWGFLHATYPQQPGYIRGLEVGIIGVAAGFLMLRFGIAATLIWHYTVDAVLIGMFLLRAESLYFQLSGWVVGGAVLLPLLVSIAFYLKRGGFVADAEMLNWAQPAVEPSVPEGEREALLPAVEPPWRAQWLYVAAVALGLAGALLPSWRFGDFIRLRLWRPEAERIARQELGRLGGGGEWRQVTRFASRLSTDEFEYLRRVSGTRAADDAVRERTNTGLWVTRFLQPLRKEEWHIFLDQSGRLVRRDHLLEEKAPGANLPAEEARRLAEEYLVGIHSVPVERYKLVDAATDKRERRTDHAFTWEDPSFQAEQARARVRVSVVGDEPTGPWKFLKLPEVWLREQHKPRLAGLLIPGTLGAAAVLLLIGFIRRLSRRGAHVYHWAWYFSAAATGLLVAAVSSLNQWPVLLAGYDTARPLENFYTESILWRLIGALLAGSAMFLAAFAADVFLQMAAGRRESRRPSVARAAAILLAVWGLLRVVSGTDRWIPGPRLSLPLWNLPGADTILPGGEVLLRSLMTAVAVLCILIIAVCTARYYLNPRGRMLLVAVASLVFAASRAQHPAQFAHAVLGATALCGLLLLIVRTCAADLVTFGVALFWLASAGPAAVLTRQPAPFLLWNGIGSAGVALGAGLLAVRLFGRRLGSRIPPQASAGC
jgi:membrane protease YdiL (CAAX protease family)